MLFGIFNSLLCMIHIYINIRTNSTNECLKILLGTKLKTCQNNSAYKLPAVQKKKKKRECAAN